MCVYNEFDYMIVGKEVSERASVIV